MDADRYSRNVALFGEQGQAKLRTARVAVVGLGGLGSHVVQQLAYLGVLEYGLVDFDFVTESSLNRLIGAMPSDVPAGTKKIAVADRVIRAIQPDARIESVDGRLTDDAAAALLAGADVVFGCLDRDVHRLELTELCCRQAKPYFDLASDVFPDGDELRYGGRVVFCNGSRCLVCLELLDQKQISLDRMDPAQRNEDRQIYGVDRDALGRFGPAVVSLNGVVASLAVTEFMVYITGLREPAGQLTYVAEQGGVRLSKDQPEDCYYCAGLWGSAAAA
jgi:hypothetical protein